MSRGEDLHDIVGHYWHEKLDPLAAPEGLADEALARAQSVVSDRPRRSGYGRRSAIGIAAVVLLSVAGVWGVSRPSEPQPNAVSAVHTVQTRPVARAGMGTLAEFTASANSRLWVLRYKDGYWDVLTRTPTSPGWTVSTALAGRRGAIPALSFDQTQGWLVVPSRRGGWVAEHTDNNGHRWRRTTLPSIPRGFTAVRISLGGQSLYAVWGGSSSHPSQLYRKIRHGWVRVFAQGLPRRVNGLMLNRSGRGELVAAGRVYRTRDGGATWELSAPTGFGMVQAVAPTSELAPQAVAPMAELAPQAVASAVLEHLVASSGGRTWAAVGGYLWFRGAGRQSWRKVGKLPVGLPLSLAAEPHALYLLVSGGPLYVSVNGGRRWVVWLKR